MPRQGYALAAADSGRPPTSASPKTDAAVSGEGWSISDLAREFDVTLRTLRFYEARGLLAPQRAGMTRIYSQRDRSRLALILKGKQLGFTLVEIRAMLAQEEGRAGDADTASVAGLKLSREQAAEQLELLKSQRAEIDQAIAELEATLEAAPEPAGR